MPIYEYECPRCGNIIELLRRREEDSPRLVSTLYCNSTTDNDTLCMTPMHKRLSATSLKFVGAGFYENDYKKKT